MSKPEYTFNEARDAFLKALNDYQTATREMTSALQRVSGHTQKFYESLDNVVHTSGTMITPRS